MPREILGAWLRYVPRDGAKMNSCSGTPVGPVLWPPVLLRRGVFGCVVLGLFRAGVIYSALFFSLNITHWPLCPLCQCYIGRDETGGGGGAMMGNLSLTLGRAVVHKFTARTSEGPFLSCLSVVSRFLFPPSEYINIPTTSDAAFHDLSDRAVSGAFPFLRNTIPSVNLFLLLGFDTHKKQGVGRGTIRGAVRYRHCTEEL